VQNQSEMDKNAVKYGHIVKYVLKRVIEFLLFVSIL